MSDVADDALKGDWKWIPHHKFEIETDMVIEFEGLSCNIADATGKIVHTLGPKDGKTERLVHAKYRCYVLKAWVKFEKTGAV